MQKNADLKQTHNFYESIRTTTIEFPSQPKKLNNRNASVDSHSKPRDPEFETYQKISHERIRMLERQLKDLSEQLDKMQKINKKLVENKLQVDPVEMHYMVQELIVADFKKELIETQSEVEKNRIETEKAKRKIEQLILENKKLEGSIKRYRKILGDMTGTQRYSAVSENLKDIPESPSSQLPNINKSYDSGRALNSSMSIRSTEKPLHRIIPQIETSLSDISSVETLHDLLTQLSKACKNILNCEKCSIFLISPLIQQLYTTFFTSYHNIHRVLLGTN